MARLLRRFSAVPVFLSFFLLAFASATQAQTAPRLQLFGNYSQLRLDSKPLGFSDWSGLNGGNVGFDFNLTPQFGAVGEIGGNWGYPWKFYDAMAGPRITKPFGKFTVFGQGLLGRAKMHIALPGETNGGESESGFAYGGGLGVDYAWRPRISIRVFQADYLHTSLLQTDQNNIRFSIGITYNLGEIGRRRHRLP